MNINNPTTFGTPSLTLSTSNSSGTGGALRADDTILVYDTTLPDPITYSQSGSVGNVSTASRRDHAHGMAAATPTVVEAVFFTRTAAAASGAVTYGGASTEPSGAIVVARSTTNASSLSIGVAEGDLTDHMAGYYGFDSTPVGFSNSDSCVGAIDAAGSDIQIGQMSAWTSTGGTITWSKGGSGDAVSGYIVWFT